MIGRRRNPFNNPDVPCPLSLDHVKILAEYNSERARGLVHTVEWTTKMGRWQQEYDDWTQACARAAGMVTSHRTGRKCSPDL